MNCVTCTGTCTVKCLESSQYDGLLLHSRAFDSIDDSRRDFLPGFRVFRTDFACLFVVRTCMYQSPVRNFRVIVSRPTSTIEIPRGDLRSITQSREAITQLLRATILPLPAHLNISCVLNYYRRISFIGSFVIIFCSRLHKP